MREWLKDIRLKKKMTQKDVSSLIGTTRAGYTMIEIGNRRPSPELARRIAQVLGFPNEWYKLLDPPESA